MKLCSEDCMPICDFCNFYRDQSYNIKGKFVGEGICIKKDIIVFADEACEDDFECRRCDKESEDRNDNNNTK